MDPLERSLRTPLNAVRAFECAARLRSFTRAARELGVTQGAVSRQVASLEHHLGQKLFRRVGRGIEVTHAGQHYAAEIRDALGRIDAAGARLMRHADDTVLTVGATPAASRWLVGRLAEFQRAHPALSVHLRVLDSILDLAGSGADIAVTAEAAESPSLASAEIAREVLTPVCSARHPLARDPDRLAEAVLLHLTSHADAWPRWLEQAGRSHPDSLAGPVFDDPSLAIEAAIQGQGVAMAPRFSVDTDLRSGRLAAPFAAGIESGRGYHLSWPKAKARLPRVRLFRDFLLPG